MKIGLLSDTHAFLNTRIFDFFNECDEVWHAGDIGSIEIAKQLESFKTFRAVYGNIDGHDIRIRYPLEQVFTCEEVKVYMTHIGGYPNRYAPGIKERLNETHPKLFISGHSHILKVMNDKELKILHINPGAAGKYGLHKKKTIVRFVIDKDRISNLEVIELG